VTSVAPGYPLSVHVKDAVLRKCSTTPTCPRPAPLTPAVTEIRPETQAVEAAWAGARLDVAFLVSVIVMVVVEVDLAEVDVDVAGDDEPQPEIAAIPARQTRMRLTCRWRSSAIRDSPTSG
jgi:hypothetical protein